MLNGHIDRLKSMLSQKSEVIDQLENQNKQNIAIAADLKRTIHEVNNKNAALL